MARFALVYKVSQLIDNQEVRWYNLEANGVPQTRNTLEVGMGTLSETFRAIRPRLLRIEGGGWLAISELDAPIRIGVKGLTQDEARAKFEAEAAEWGRLLDEAREEHG
jgi:hypothetical protein